MLVSPTAAPAAAEQTGDDGADADGHEPAEEAGAPVQAAELLALPGPRGLHRVAGQRPAVRRARAPRRAPRSAPRAVEPPVRGPRARAARRCPRPLEPVSPSRRASCVSPASARVLVATAPDPTRPCRRPA